MEKYLYEFSYTKCVLGQVLAILDIFTGFRLTIEEDRADKLARCLELGGERPKDEEIGFRKNSFTPI